MWSARNLYGGNNALHWIDFRCRQPRALPQKPFHHGDTEPQRKAIRLKRISQQWLGPDLCLFIVFSVSPCFHSWFLLRSREEFQCLLERSFIFHVQAFTRAIDLPHQAAQHFSMAGFNNYMTI